MAFVINREIISSPQDLYKAIFHDRFTLYDDDMSLVWANAQGQIMYKQPRAYPVEYKYILETDGHNWRIWALREVPETETT